MPNVLNPYVPASAFDPIAGVYASPRVGIFRFKPYYDYTAGAWKNQLDEMGQHGPYYIRAHGQLGVGDGATVEFYFDEAGPAGERLFQESADPIQDTMKVWVQNPADEWKWESAGTWTYDKDGDRKRITFDSAPLAGRIIMISFFTQDYVLV